ERWDDPRSSVHRQPRDDGEAALERSLLAGSREIALDRDPGDGLALLAVGWLRGREAARLKRQGRPAPPPSEPLEWLLEARYDLRGLPLLAGDACRTGEDQAR